MVSRETKIKQLLAKKAEIHTSPIVVYHCKNYFVEVECSMNGLGISDAQFDIINAIEDSNMFYVVDWKFEQRKNKIGKLTIEFKIDEFFDVVIEDIIYCENEIQRLKETKETLEKML